MVDRIHVVPIEPMARDLAKYGRWRSAEEAIFRLHGERYLAPDIHAGLDQVLARAEEILAAAASNHPVARALAIVRDLAACAVIVSAVFLWGMPA